MSKQKKRSIFAVSQLRANVHFPVVTLQRSSNKLEYFCLTIATARRPSSSQLPMHVFPIARKKNVESDFGPTPRTANRRPAQGLRSPGHGSFFWPSSCPASVASRGAAAMDLTDAMTVFGDEELPAHSLLLQPASPVSRAMFVSRVPVPCHTAAAVGRGGPRSLDSLYIRLCGNGRLHGHMEC